MSYMTFIQNTYTVTASAGNSQEFFTSALQNGGFLERITISKPTGTSNHLSSGAGLTLTGSLSSAVLFQATATGASGSVVSYYPRAAAQNTAGAIYSAATGAGAVVGIPVRNPVGAGEALKLTVASATATGSPNVASGAGLTFTVSYYLSAN